MMYFTKIVNQIEYFLNDKDFLFLEKSIIRCNEKEGSLVIKFSNEKNTFYVKGFTKRTKEEIQVETKFINLISESGIYTPELLDIAGEKVFCCCYEDTKVIFYVMSEFIGDSIVNDETYIDIAIKIARLHNMKSKFKHLDENKGKSDHERLLEFLNIHRDFSPDIIDCGEVQTMIKSHISSDEFCFIHADLYMDNIIIRNGSLYGLIDFSDLRNGLPEDDFGKYLQNLLTSQLDILTEAKKIVEAYGKSRTDAVDFKEIYISCIYHILFNFKCLYANENNKELYEDIKIKYREAIEFCIMEYKQYE